MIDLEKIKKDAEGIFGAFLKDEISALAEIANSLGQDKNFVELGCYCGRSSSILGQIARENDCSFFCVDKFVEFPPDLHTAEAVKGYFHQNMRLVNARYTLFYSSFTEASKIYDQEIDLLFIDGNHEYEAVKEDIVNWLPKVKLGGMVLFHDYEGVILGVKQAVDELDNLEKIKIVESLLITRKK